MFISVTVYYIESCEARISPYYHVYLYGLGFFLTFRIYNCHPFS
ncbi:4-amino-4-deoxychorismate lyase, partial [Bacillus tropicus]|nr:4-amino-4-deoxychorismate lyase [Bacillus tropicus]